MAIENKPSKNEEEYFARENAELIKRLRAERDVARAEVAASPTASMKCPRCDAMLVEREYHHMRIDECPSCGGVFLDKAELELLEHVTPTSRRGFLSGLLGLRD